MCPRFCRGAGSICERKTVYKSLCLYVREKPSISRRPADLVLLDSRGVADGVVGGSRPPHFWKPGRSTPPPQIREWSGQNTVFFRFLGYFGVGWPNCRQFDPPLKNPWRRHCSIGSSVKSVRLVPVPTWNNASPLCGVDVYTIRHRRSQIVSTTWKHATYDLSAQSP